MITLVLCLPEDKPDIIINSPSLWDKGLKDSYGKVDFLDKTQDIVGNDLNMQ